MSGLPKGVYCDNLTARVHAMDDQFLDDLLPDFIEEAEEHLQTIEADLLLIERDGAAIDLELVNKVFRGVHSIKGAAGFLGLETIGELAHALESVLDGIRQEEIPPLADIVDALLSSADVLRDLIENVHTSNDRDIATQVQRLQGVVSATNEIAEDLTQTGEKLPPAEATAHAPSTREERAGPSVESTVRVSVSTLDKLMNLVGELVLGRNRLMRVASEVPRVDMKEATHRINQATSELQISVMETRMQPVGNVFSKFPRVVRDLCKKLGKEAELVLAGEDVDLDRSLIEAISDPLTHLVRNSIDHGIETPDARRAAGKPARGRVELSAFHRGGKVHIVIADDGNGISPEALRRAAVLKGLLSETEAQDLNDQEAVNLIFRAGFSTAKEVTDVSGRGVGMDVVRTNLEALSSSIEIESEIGRGSVITIKVPLTLAIMAAVIVTSGGQSFAIPQANVRELVTIRDVRSVEPTPGGPVLRLRGSLLPLVRLDDIVGPELTDKVDWSTPTTVVVVDTGIAVFGICIERYPTAEEIVVKPLGEHLRPIREFGGATILGDGSVALILDVNGIGAGLKLRRIEQLADDETSEGPSTLSSSSSNQEKVLLFSGHDEELFALPLPVLARIERVSASEVREIGGRLVWERTDCIMPLIRPQDVIRAREIAPAPRYMVMVTRVGGHELGLLAPGIHDILETELHLETELKEPGVFGSFQHEGRVVRLLDFAIMAGKADDQRCPQGADDSGPPPPARILFAEDSRFFREQTCNFLKSQGMQVTACEDGLEAWKTLEASSEPFDIVLTDIEMPVMNGLEFTRKIKSDSRFSNLPVIALTSLSGESDISRGQLSGVDDYQVKLDKKGLIQAIRGFMQVAA